MPTYDCTCAQCGWFGERLTQMEQRNNIRCPECRALVSRQVAAPIFKFTGRVTPGGGPDRFTADMLGIPLKELPEGLKS